MRTLNVNGTRFALPESMSVKDIQALLGFVATLQTIDSHYDYEASDYLYSVGRFPEVRIEDLEVTPLAKAKSETSYKRWKEQREAEKAAEA
jgi:hypothetical protein